ncbi:hypothetical protein QBC38DRAFT_511618 [Podospora fimiseda]|uniref:CN hydrolase domain-containing protein n=1 Tax=Podospora fimiseda TaxID=252190 RepID=A0AAN7H041_9PEZI|nr:hypothetical protein QBC38DRAFT_511618 [Podospora fimiseda]
MTCVSRLLIDLSKSIAKSRASLPCHADSGSHLAILPEYHLTSWVSSSPSFASCCDYSSKLYLPKYKLLAKELNIHIVPGTIIISTTTTSSTTTPQETQLCNMAYLIAAGTGKILASYRYQKRILCHPERDILTPGPLPSHVAFDLPIPRTSDIIRTEIDPAVLAINPNSETQSLDAVVAARSYENTCAVVLCNAFGRSQVSLLMMGCLGDGPLGVEEKASLQVKVDFGIVRFAQEEYRVRRDVNGDGWISERLGGDDTKRN